MFQSKDKDLLGIYKYGCDPFCVSLLTDRHLKVTNTDFVMISRQRRVYVCAWLVASRIARRKLGHDILCHVSNFRHSERDNYFVIGKKTSRKHFEKNNSYPWMIIVVHATRISQDWGQISVMWSISCMMTTLLQGTFIYKIWVVSDLHFMYSSQFPRDFTGIPCNRCKVHVQGAGVGQVYLCQSILQTSCTNPWHQCKR